MNITEKERLMYEIMAAIYNSGIPISFKGSMVLKACLLEYGYSGQIRHTVDVDANWHSKIPPTIQQMASSMQKAIDNHNVEVNIKATREYGNGRSAGFKIFDVNTNNLLFSMDIDVNRPITPTRLYGIEGIHFSGVSPIQMIADKTCVLSTDKVFRRVKDVIDLYYLSSVFSFNKEEVLKTIDNSGRTLDSFHGFLYRTDDLKHSYEKFRLEGEVYKPPFDEVYDTVKAYVKDVLPPNMFNDRINDRGYREENFAFPRKMNLEEKLQRIEQQRECIENSQKPKQKNDSYER